MLTPPSNTKIYLCTGTTDMRKGVGGLALLAELQGLNQLNTGALFAFRGKRADKIKILWWDGQGYCLFYKRFERGTFVWPKAQTPDPVTITQGQLSMLIEGIDWRTPQWSDPPVYAG